MRERTQGKEWDEKEILMWEGEKGGKESERGHGGKGKERSGRGLGVGIHS